MCHHDSQDMFQLALVYVNFHKHLGYMASPRFDRRASCGAVCLIQEWPWLMHMKQASGTVEDTYRKEIPHHSTKRAEQSSHEGC